MTYTIEWREVDAGAGTGLTELKPFYTDPETEKTIEPAWVPQYGSQLAFLHATQIFEVLYEGSRGGGKTDCLIMDFAQHVGKGYGAEWRGVLFRQTYPQLADVINKTTKLFRKIFPDAKYNKVEHKWTFATGEELLLRHMKSPDDYWSMHGHAYPFIAWEELCNWPDDKCYTVMMSCCRSTKAGMPRCYRATTNPYGPGFNWIKRRFRLPHSRGRIIRDSYKEGQKEPPRLAIHSSIHENKILMHADPEYISKIRAAARNPSELAAWLEGSWDIVAGGMFDDLWRSDVHVVPSIPAHAVPKRWKIDRSFDWGSSRPFAVCWWAESNGEPLIYNDQSYGRVRGDLIQIQEWYGWNGTPNEGVRMTAREIARGIRDREDEWGIQDRTKAGPADAAIFDVQNGASIAGDMEAEKVTWQPADKSPGSRKHGWEQIRKALSGSLPTTAGVRDFPGLFVSAACPRTIELMQSLPRDDKDLDDVDTTAEDHLADAMRYRVRKKLRGVTQKGF